MTWVTTVREGLEYLTHLTPDKAVLDLMLPDGDGVEVLRHIRRHQMPTRVVIATGEYVKRQDVRDLEPDLFLFKPINLEHFTDWLDK